MLRSEGVKLNSLKKKSVCVSKTYGSVRDLLQPKKLGDSDRIKRNLRGFRTPFLTEPSLIAERFKFNSRSRQDGKKVAQFVAGLRRLLERCKFGTILEDMLRDE